MPPPTNVHTPIVAAFARAHPGAVFVQIGSNDGEQQDPLRTAIIEQKWTGVMVEPVPYVFERLRANYGAVEGVRLDQVAIADADGTRTLHYLPESDDASLPRWYDALASFRRDVVLKHRQFIPDIDDRIQAMDVPCLTFDSLCRKHGLETVDVVQIDTEGYDFEIIRTIDFDRHAPLMLIYEDMHLDAATRAACTAHLARHGYRGVQNGMDVLCLRMPALTGRDRQVRRAFRLARRWRPV